MEEDKTLTGAISALILTLLGSASGLVAADAAHSDPNKASHTVSPNAIAPYSDSAWG